MPKRRDQLALKKLLMSLIGLAMLMLLPERCHCRFFHFGNQCGGGLIPLNGKCGILTVRSDGTRETSGFDVTASQSFWLEYGVSHGAWCYD